MLLSAFCFHFVRSLPWANGHFECPARYYACPSSAFWNFVGVATVVLRGRTLVSWLCVPRAFIFWHFRFFIFSPFPSFLFFVFDCGGGLSLPFANRSWRKPCSRYAHLWLFMADEFPGSPPIHFIATFPLGPAAWSSMGIVRRVHSSSRFLVRANVSQ